MGPGQSRSGADAPLPLPAFRAAKYPYAVREVELLNTIADSPD